MSLLTVLRSGVKLADKITKSLQPGVLYYRASRRGDGYGIVFAAPVTLHAIVDWKQVQVRTSSGTLSTSRAVITLLNITEVDAATGGEGIGDNDKFVLPDGTTGPILDMSGFIDAGTGHPLATEVYLG